MKKINFFKRISLIITAGIPFILNQSVYAASVGGVSSVDSFIKSLIQIIAGLAGLVATGFFVIGGFS